MPFNPPKPPNAYPIKGVPVGKGEKPRVRPEIRDLKQDKDAWNLYLLGYWQFQLVPTDNPFSYYRIAGIHGLPYEEWPKHNKTLLDLRVQEDTGFCTHTSILFLPWHRPYLALFESVLRDAMIYVAGQFTEAEGKQKYLAVAEKFRMPYWDWARQDLDRFPRDATDSASTSVKMPESLYSYYNSKEPGRYKRQPDGTVQIPNPLYSWKFLHGTNVEIPKLTFETPPLKGTTRWFVEDSTAVTTPQKQGATLSEVLTPFYQDATVINQVRNSTANLGERLTILLNGYSGFAGVSNNRWASADEKRLAGTEFGSFEDIHNSIHVLVGGASRDGQGRQRDGQMSQVPQSAFDPIFWLHHTNVDRVLAIWQGLHSDTKNPNTWVVEESSEYGNWGTPVGGKEDQHTKLLPFYKDTETFYNSDKVRETSDFGYAYPETQSWLFPSGAAYRKDIRNKLARLYPTGSLSTLVATSRSGDTSADEELRKRALALNLITAADEPSTVSTSLALAADQSSITPELASALPQIPLPAVDPLGSRSLADLVKGETYLEWLFNVKAPKHALSGGYQVHVFLGSVPNEEPTALYAISPYQVGSFVPLGQPNDTKCEKCKKDQAAEIAITGQIPLTIALVERYFAGQLESLEERHVVPYLQENLHWEVVDQNGQRQAGHRDVIDGLLVGVISNEVTLARPGQEYTVYAPTITVYPEITTKANGRDGRGEGTGVTEQNKFFE